MRNRKLCLSLLLLCLPLLGSNCDKAGSPKEGAELAELPLAEQPPAELPTTPMPEPAAALVFGVGALIIGSALKSKKKLS